MDKKVKREMSNYTKEVTNIGFLDKERDIRLCRDCWDRERKKIKKRRKMSASDLESLTGIPAEKIRRMKGRKGIISTSRTNNWRELQQIEA